jgi:hypothetical protein
MERISYAVIKELLLSYYWRGCRDHGFAGWLPEQVSAWAYGEFEGSYDLPIENLMLEVASLVLTGGWFSDQARYHKEEILRILSVINLNAQLTELPQEEAEEFTNDLRVLNLF